MVTYSLTFKIRICSSETSDGLNRTIRRRIPEERSPRRQLHGECQSVSKCHFHKTYRSFGVTLRTLLSTILCTLGYTRIFGRVPPKGAGLRFSSPDI
jgi:hypothetical protein